MDFSKVKTIQIPEGNVIKIQDKDGSVLWSNLDHYTYGVSWQPNDPSPICKRVGNLELHKTLPIQNGMRGCIAQMKDGAKIMYYLNEDDWRFRTPEDAKNHTLKNIISTTFGDKTYYIEDPVFSTLQYENQYVKINGIINNNEDYRFDNIIGQIIDIDTKDNNAAIYVDDEGFGYNVEEIRFDTIELGAVLNGYDGEVMVEVPEFWIRSWDTDTRREVRISTKKIDDTWEHQPKVLIGAYHDTVLNTVPENMGYLSTLEQKSAVCIANINDYCRGGSNDASYDQYIDTDRFRSLLGKPRTSMSRATMRANCRKSGKEILSYLQYKRVLYWLYVIEYANFDCQARFNSELTSEGYKQGGLGDGVVTVNGNYWNFYINYNPLTPNGYTNEFGNGTNIKAMTMVMPTTSGGEPENETIQYVPRWHGIENPFGDIWNNVDGIIINASSIENSGIRYNEVYATDNPTLYNDSDYSKMRVIGIELNEKGYIKEFDLGNTAEIIPRLNGDIITQYKCDYHNINNTTGLGTLILGGQSTDKSYCGLGDFYSGRNVIISSVNIGFRSSCILP